MFDPSQQGAKVFICIPNLGNIHSLLAQRLIEWHVTPTAGVDQIAVFMPRNIQPHDSARNHCVQKFLETDCTHLFFIDSDVIPPSDALRKLLEPNVPAISGAYPIMRAKETGGKLHRAYALFNMAEVEDGKKEMVPVTGEGIQEIDFCGGGCLLIRRDVFDKIEMPAFKWMYTEKGDAAYGEDIDFGKKLIDAGIQLYGDLSVECYHFKPILL